LNKLVDHIVTWLKEYALNARMDGFVIGISGGIDSAVTSSLCAKTGLKVIGVNLPIRQSSHEFTLAKAHLSYLSSRYPNSKELEINLSDVFSQFENTMPSDCKNNKLSMANSRSRIRMTTLYAVAQTNNCLVAGTGNKVEDFGIGFYTKYGDGGVDLSPIADLSKSQVWAVGKYLGILPEILDAKPTDGLWGDGRSDEDQIGATYPELEWAMEFHGDETALTERQQQILEIYRTFNRINQHKMLPIPVCKIPKDIIT
jgi:NAD+ synthase